MGEAFGSEGVSGFIPVGEFLYVKWRIKGSDKIYEDRVDLTQRLPENMDHLEIHFTIRGPQLYIFVTWPWDQQPYKEEPYANEYLPVPGGVKRFRGHKQVQIYPEPLPLKP